MITDEEDNQISDDLTAEDAALWRNSTQDVDRLPGQTYKTGQKQTHSVHTHTLHVSETVVIHDKRNRETIHHTQSKKGKELDKRTFTRLKRGQIAIEATLDLHGLTQIQAQDRVYVFVQEAFQAQKRCVLIITGKGRISAPAILKQRVSEWLNDPPVKDMVLQVVPAHPKHGGSGAFYVYLRRIK